MEILFKKKSEYDKLQIFGSRCYPSLRPYRDHKLDYKSKPYIFLDYLISQDGYSFFDPIERRGYVSRNVILLKAISP